MNREQQIFKRLSTNYNWLKKNYPEYNCIYFALQGSQNYNLDMYTDDYMSDVDSKAIIVPNLEDIVNNTTPISTTLVLPNNEHIDVKDIRLMVENFKKQNINFLEILFTKYRIINKTYKDLIMALIDNNELVARFNTNQLLRCMAGMSMEKRKALCHPYPTILHKIEKWGYDGKQLHHIIRMNEFMKAWLSGKSFMECLTSYSNIDLLMDAKLNKMPLEEAIKLADEYDTETNMLKDNNVTEEDIINKEAEQVLNTFKYRVIKRALTLELEQPIPINKPINYEGKYNNIFVTSDLHLFHSNILKYEEGRLGLVDETITEYVTRMTRLHSGLEISDDMITYYMNKYYNDKVKEMNDTIMLRWNSTVGKDDLVFILGDIALNYNSIEDVNELIKGLNGDKILILGNHDKSLMQNRQFDRSLFKEIVDYKFVRLYGKFITMCHYPMSSFDMQGHNGMLLYGHLHSTPLKYPILHSYNVGLDVNNYKPINIKEFIEQDNLILEDEYRHNEPRI